MVVQVYAVLKDYFEESVTIGTDDIHSASDLIDKLSELNPQAAGVLKKCRVAVDMKFVSGDYKLSTHDSISVIPPSSGG
ncbi:MAG TPA: MoaD/ThiS family protein [Cytophagaceae bacterium]|jgi:molybdopterin converting factor small subunit|nr:MoaD/ThiS family protein [Cytophagaceae bacterium]